MVRAPLTMKAVARTGEGCFAARMCEAAAERELLLMADEFARNYHVPDSVSGFPTLLRKWGYGVIKGAQHDGALALRVFRGEGETGVVSRNQ